MRSRILGTAGHIDHGKTALVKALTGVDTDRLAEERERGITIDLGFAELSEPGSELVFGVVDVPGHHGFVRNMLAGATGMDLALLVVAADEGVMPQTREHLDILVLLGVPRLVVALTKCDLVDDEWLALVRDDVAGLVQGAGWDDAPIVSVSARTGEGLDALRAALFSEAARIPPSDADDLVVLPVDRAFTIRGTGTVVTGTLVSGTLVDGARLRVLPDGFEARVRGLQVHGREVGEVAPGARAAVALAGERVGLADVARGQVLVADGGWVPSSILTVRLVALDGSDWTLAHNQRVHVHLGTAEVMARLVVYDDGGEPGGELVAGGTGWAQLRTEAPVVARSGERFVLRSWSPVTTIGGGVVAEPAAPKRRRLGADDRERLARLVEADANGRVTASLELAGVAGCTPDGVMVSAGVAPSVLEQLGGLPAVERPWREAAGRWIAAGVAEWAAQVLLDALADAHAAEGWRDRIVVDRLRAALAAACLRGGPGIPGGDAAPGLIDAVIGDLAAAGRIDVEAGRCRLPGHTPHFTEAEAALLDRIAAVYRDAGLAPPTVDELPAALGTDPLFEPFVLHLVAEGRLVRLDSTLFAWAAAIDAAAACVATELAGRSGLGPADFRDVIPVTRKHLLPILNHLDARGVTLRDGEGRRVP